MSIILNPVEQFFDLDGSPLDQGYIYLGSVNDNPETAPVQVYWDNLFTIPAAQPIRTVNGYPVRAGTPAPIFSNQDVSIQVRNKKSESVFYASNSSQSANSSNISIRSSNTLIVNSDNGKTILASGTFNQTFDACVTLGNGWSVTYANVGSGTITLDPNLSETVDSFATEKLRPGDMCIIYCDGIDLFTSGLYSLNVIRYNLTNAPIMNGYIEWSTSGGALTAAVKTLAGTDPTPIDPVFTRFRSPTLGTAGYFIRSITAALSVTVPSGQAVGTVSAQASRIRAVFMDNAGTVVLGVYNSWNNTTKSLLALDESNVYSSTAIAAAPSAQVIYTTSAQASLPIAECGYVESIQTTAGTWAQTLDRKVTAGVGYYRTGDVVQQITTASGAVITGTTTIPIDDTIPQNTEGVALTALDTAFTPISACNLARVSVTIGETGNSAAPIYTLALFEDSVANALAASITQLGSRDAMSINNYTKILNTASTKTFKARLGGSAAGTQTINGASGAREFGGVVNSNITVTEIFV